MSSDHDRLDERARRQFGLVRFDEAVELLGRAATRREVASGRLVPVERGVYRCAGVPSSFRQRALAACLACGPLVAVSHASAGRLWSIEGVVASGPVELSVPRGRSAAAGRTHRARLDEGDVTSLYGIPVTTPARTLRDLAGVVTPAVLEQAVDDLLRSGRLDRGSLEAALAPGRGVDGAGELRRLALARLGGAAPGDSRWVDDIVRWLLDAGLPAPEVQHQVVVGGRVYVLDVAYVPWRVAIEFNGWQWHQTRSRTDADHVRRTELELAGWMVLVVTSAHPAATVVGWVRRALDQRWGWIGPAGQAARAGMLGR